MVETRRKVVLIVEDDPAMRRALAGLVEAEGYAVRAAGNGREALDLLASEEAPPSLILLDLMMPVMDGWRFLAERRRIAPPRSGAPVVLLSGLGFIADATDVSDFLRKPVDARALVDCVRRFCGDPVEAPAAGAAAARTR
jgi:CheY-like chemotaxis protein